MNPAKAFENDMRRIGEKISDAKISLLFERLDKQDALIRRLCPHKDNKYEAIGYNSFTYSFAGVNNGWNTMQASVHTHRKTCTLCGCSYTITEQTYLEEMQQMCKEKLETKTKKKTTKKGKKNV
jgi:hypothetical protein